MISSETIFSVRSLPRRNENNRKSDYFPTFLFRSEAYLEGMKTRLYDVITVHMIKSEAYLEGMKTRTLLLISVLELQ